MNPSPKPASLIGSPRQIRALASPARQDVVDCLQAIGPASVAEIARELGRPADSLYYHVRLLVKVRLVREVDVRKAGRRSESVFDVCARPIRLQYRPSSRANTQAVTKTSRAMLRLAERDFERGLHRPDACVDGPARNLWAGRLVGRLTAEELIELNVHFRRIEEIFHESRGRNDGALQAVTFALAPLRDRTPLKEKST